MIKAKFSSFIFTVLLLSISLLSNASAETINHAWRDASNVLITARVHQPNSKRTIHYRPKEAGESDRYYLQSAFRALDTDYRHNVNLVIPKGVYNITDTGVVKTLYHLNSLINVSIDFSDSTLIIHEQVKLFNIDGSNKLALKNLSIVYNTPLASLGTVYKRDGIIGFKLDSDYKERLANFRSSFRDLQKVISASPDARDADSQLWSETAKSLPMYQGEFEHQGEGKFNDDVFYSRDDGIFEMREGSLLAQRVSSFGSHEDPVVLFHFSHGNNAITVNGGSNISFRKVRFFGVPGMAIFAYKVRTGILIEKCIIAPPSLLPSNNLALLGSSADGFHISQGSSNVIIKDNYIKRTGDDSIAYNSTSPYEVTDIVPYISSGVSSSTAKFAKLTPKAIISTSTSGDSARFLITDGAYTPRSPSALQGTDKTNEAGFVIPRNLESQVKVGDIAYQIYAQSRVAVVNNFIRDSNARGIHSLSSNVYIANNKIYNTAISAISITADTSHFFEGNRLSNIKIFNNLINNSGKDYLARMPSTVRFAGIHVGLEVGQSYRQGIKPYPPQNNSVFNVWIGANRVVNTPVSLGLFSARNVQVWSNDFSHIPSYHSEHRTGARYGFDITGSTYCEATRDVTSNIPNLCQ